MAKIGILHYSIPPVMGGVEEIIAHHARLFLEHGHWVWLITGEGSFSVEGARYMFVPDMKSHPGASPSEIRNSLLRDTLWPELDLLIVHNVFTMPFNLGLTWALWEMAHWVRTVAWCHDAAYLDPTYHLPPPDEEPYSLLVKAHPEVVYVAISEYRRRALEKLLGTAVRVIPDGIDPGRFLGDKMGSWARKAGVLKADLVALAPVRLTPRKNLEQAIRIIAEMKRLGRNAFLLITAPGDPHNPSFSDYYGKLKALARRLGVARKVRFLTQEIGPIENPLAFFSLADFVLLVSNMEGFGLPAIEAALMRMPGVLSDIPPLREIAEGLESVMFVDPKAKARDIAPRVLEFLDSQPALRDRRKILDRFSWDSIYEKHLGPLVEELCPPRP